MAKRKREQGNHEAEKFNGTKIAKTISHADVKTVEPVIQIVAGSYERVLHGITASISDFSSSKSSPSITFADTFLFNAHSSAIRCLALSPLPETDSADTQGVYLASGGSDERINVYSISASPPMESDRIPAMPTLGKNKISENPRNRELGALLQHYSSVTALHFPTRSKLLSASEDNTIAISRTKDLTVVSTIKAPHPKVQGQPSGDTAPPGATPAGVNDFAVHPSMKLMVSVGRGEKCMRLWNLVTGKKAGVLNFGREVLQGVKESKYSSGEGRRIRWSPDGNEFAVAFERGAVVFGEDSKPVCKVLPQPLTKLHQMHYLEMPDGRAPLLTVSTEDGRILLYSTTTQTSSQNGHKDSISDAKLIAHLGGKPQGISGRIKDFKIIQLQDNLIIIAASSDGTIRIWQVQMKELAATDTAQVGKVAGTVIGSYETGNRITCLTAFLMQAMRPEDAAGVSDYEGLTEGSVDVDSDSDSE